ncbi:MAG: hypothetical protein M1454_00325 [Candidatus Thermoplasmatota archaeon]|nr:hypothetical protein [Candidatus Thermoplasmatota archaeon]MCL5731090.1 hypothetical protein [Candidatus Thermoplasmatota archaeon]
MGDMICTAVNGDETIDSFVRAKYLIVYDENKKELAVQIRNPAVVKNKGKKGFVRECISLKANVILVPHGSLTYGCNRMLKKAGIKVLVVDPGEHFLKARTRKPSFMEILYSTLKREPVEKK